MVILAIHALLPAGRAHGLVPGSEPMHPRAAGGNVYFSADDRAHGRELWRCDSDGVCSLVADLAPGPAGSEPTNLLAVGDYLYFQTTSAVYGSHVCFVHPQDNIVINLTQTIPSLSKATILGMQTTDTWIFFIAAVNDAHMEIWRTRAGSMAAERLYTTGLSANNRSRQLFMLGPAGGRMSLLLEHEIKLWDESGLAAAVFYLPEGCNPQVVLGGDPEGKMLLALLDDYELGHELYHLCLETRRWTLVKDIYPGPASSNVSESRMHRGWLYFAANDGVHGKELWRSDGTPEGTQLVLDIAPGDASSNPYKFCPVGDWLYFVAENETYGTELWRTDGTAEGTRLVSDLTPGPASSGLWSLTAFQDQLFFCAETPAHGQEVFVTGGTAETTRVFIDIVPGPGSSGPHNLTPYNGTLFFTCDDGIHGEEPWVSDGTEAGTRIAANIALPRKPLSSMPEHLMALEDRVIFSANDALHGREPWVCDGTEAGTLLLADIMPGKAGSNPGPFVRCLNRIFFAADTPGRGRELWTTEGAPDSTRLIRDLTPGILGTSPELLTAHGEHLYFVAADSRQNRELWRLNGFSLAAELFLTADRVPAPIEDIVPAWDEIYLYCAASGDSKALYRLAETAGHGHRALPIPDSPSDLEALLDLWIDKETNLFFKDSMVKFLYPPRISSKSAETLQGPGGLYYFTAHTASYGMELWASDATPSGTRIIRDLYPGPASSSPEHLTMFDERLYFVAETPGEGRVLFVSDGSPAGTIPVYANHVTFTWPPLKTYAVAATERGLITVSMLPGRAAIQGLHLTGVSTAPESPHFIRPLLRLKDERSLWPLSLVAAGGKLFFVHWDERYGTELWSCDFTVEGTNMVKDIAVARER